MPHWRVIEATGSSAERRITQPGHSPIAGATQDIGATEEASSPWADTGLAQGARPPSQRTGPASSVTAYNKDAPDAKSAFFSSAIHRVLPSRSSSQKRLHPPSPPSYLMDHHSSAQLKLFINFYTHSLVIYIILCLILTCYQSLGH